MKGGRWRRARESEEKEEERRQSGEGAMSEGRRETLMSI